MHKLGITIHPNEINGDLTLLRQGLERVAQSGAECCELVLHGLDVVVGGKIVPDRLNAVLRLMHEYALEYTLHLPYDMNLLCLDAEAFYRKVFRVGIDFAKKAEIGLLVYHAGITNSSNDMLLREEAQTVRELAAYAGDILLCMENPLIFDDHVHSAGMSASDMRTFYEQVDMPNFKLTFDIGHSFLRHKGNADAMLADLRLALPYAGHIHLHDNCGIALPMSEYDYNHRISCGAADLHLPLGWGVIPMPAVFEILKHYKGIINLEIGKRFEEQYAESLRLARQYIDEFHE